MAAIPYAAFDALRDGTIADEKDRRALLTMGAIRYNLIRAASSGPAALYSDDFSTDTLAVYGPSTAGLAISGGTLHLADPTSGLSPDIYLPVGANVTAGKLSIGFSGATDASAFEITVFPNGSPGSPVAQATVIPFGYSGASYPALALLTVVDPSGESEAVFGSPLAAGTITLEVTASTFVMSALDTLGNVVGAATLPATITPSTEFGWHAVFNVLSNSPELTAYDNLVVTGTP